MSGVLRGLVALPYVLIAVACIGCSTASPDAAVTSSSPTTRIYASEEYGFTVEYDSPTLAPRDPETMPRVAYDPIVLLTNSEVVGDGTAVFYVNTADSGDRVLPLDTSKSQALRILREKAPQMEQAIAQGFPEPEKAKTSSRVGLLNGVPAWFCTVDIDPSAAGYEKQVNNTVVFARGRTYGVIWVVCKKTSDSDAAAVTDAAASFTTAW